MHNLVYPMEKIIHVAKTTVDKRYTKRFARILELFYTIVSFSLLFTKAWLPSLLIITISIIMGLSIAMEIALGGNITIEQIKKVKCLQPSIVRIDAVVCCMLLIDAILKLRGIS